MECTGVLYNLFRQALPQNLVEPADGNLETSDYEKLLAATVSCKKVLSNYLCNTGCNSVLVAVLKLCLIIM
jgi:hypothetical protein